MRMRRDILFLSLFTIVSCSSSSFLVRSFAVMPTTTSSSWKLHLQSNPATINNMTSKESSPIDHDLDDFFHDDWIDSYQEDGAKELGITIRLVQWDAKEDARFQAETKESISSIVKKGLEELSLLKDRMKRDNENPYDQDKVLWNREYKRQEEGLRLRLDAIASQFLKETEEQRNNVHLNAIKEEMDRETFLVRAEAASHGRKVSATENSLAKVAQLLVRAKVALQGHLPGAGAWNEWDEWTGDNVDAEYDEK